MFSLISVALYLCTGVHALGRLATSRGAGMSAVFDVDAWLGAVTVVGSIGKELHAPAKIVGFLKEAAKDGTFSDEDVPVDGTVLDDARFKDFLRVMKAIVAHGATAAKGAVSDLEAVRFEAYLKGRFLDGITEKASNKPKEPDRTPELLADLAAQGMSSWSEAIT